VIGAVNGLAAGGGFELVLACDLIVAAEHAELFLPELELGIVPDAGGAQRLPRQLPWFVAMDLLLTGRRMGAEEIARRGEGLTVQEQFTAMAAGAWPAYARALAAGDFLEASRAFADERRGSGA
jgi:crotonobetainyl-CoA hydratase